MKRGDEMPEPTAPPATWRAGRKPGEESVAAPVTWYATSIPIADPGPLDAYLPPTGGLAWLRRGDGFVGIGEAARLEGATPEQADAWWRDFATRIEQSHAGQAPTRAGQPPAEADTPGPLVFASFPFDPGNTRHRSVMVVPRIVIGRRRGRAWLSWLSTTDDQPPSVPGLAVWTGAREAAPTPPAASPIPPDATSSSPPAATPAAVRVTSRSLEREAWQRIVADAVGRIETNGLDKVVLARSVTLTAEDPLDPRHLVSALSRRYETCWTYSVDSLVGASPEMLVRLEGGLAMSRVLAGTIRRNGGEELDLKLAHSLARSSKNLVEHELAVESVAAALAPFCSGMNVPDAPYVLELPNVLHLASDVTAVAHGDVSALRLASELHPSAAVCGTPTATARKAIAELEHLDRGRYSGPVGWMNSRGDGEFAIALRCGLIDPADPRSITLYAGCGIVEESDPAEEYAETEAKLVPMLEALGVPAPH